MYVFAVNTVGMTLSDASCFSERAQRDMFENSPCHTFPNMVSCYSCYKSVAVSIPIRKSYAFCICLFSMNLGFELLRKGAYMNARRKRRTAIGQK